MKSRLNSFSELPAGFKRQLSELLSKAKSPHIGLVFYKVLVSKFTEDELEKGLKAEEFARKLESTLRELENYSLETPKLPCKKSFELKTAYRLAIGMGYPSLLENGFLFHHTYGIPYIPGETLKGLTRHVLLLSIYEGIKEKLASTQEPLNYLDKYLSSKEEEFSKNSLTETLDRTEISIILSDYKIRKPHRVFRRIFGTQEKRGEVIFLDAFPKKFNPQDLELDIMNPHYAGYYTEKGKNPPGDWESPVPIKFLTLKKGTTFIFCLDYEPLGEEEPELLEHAYNLLRVGLENLGVGGKKAKGYGWFEA
ncbi:type III-B CRISPR module RAMP protein Cmr6 [Pampinifervens florentissimum]|uniref:type III-B CRISPR module RAMP protein Cmr6 n=1 Tax=Pampinifervens florentissimum TaxID=1632019 RepID=UPI0013B4815C|nr:type III-B CRISPR module RAMP protein Cmr6 [Hydrogenobacter sp. T-8]QID32585.1 type III-B CRISPR module RAMP protein Cmr6 [Hydrogenobacter sp. T-8]